MQYYARSITDVQKEFNVSEDGLSAAQLTTQREMYGENATPRTRTQTTKLKIFFSQFTNLLMLILIAAGAISLLLGEYKDAIVIFITVAINVAVGYAQENKANEALNKLNQLIKFHAMVVRDGEKVRIPSEEIVPGDILLLEAGDKIQADGRVMEHVEFLVNEAALTGESEPLKKKTEELPEETPLADRENMVYRGTVVVSGRATVIVTATGTNTEIGKIAELVKETEDEQTPLQVAIVKLSKIIGFIVFGIVALILVVGSLVSDHGFVEMFEIAVAIAVAAIPEGLAIALTIILAIGMNFILKRNALVRKLISAETLGSVSVICTDKTGTITEGRMQLDTIVTVEESMRFKTLATLNTEEQEGHPDLMLALRAAMLANDGVLHEKDGKLVAVGDTTDTAMLEAGRTLDLTREGLEQTYNRIGEIPFSSERMYMATLHSFVGKHVMYTKGAPEVLLPKCTSYIQNGKKVDITDLLRADLQAQADEMAASGLRVLVVMQRDQMGDDIDDASMTSLTFIGLIALSDPLREDVKKTLELTQRAGIRTIMITGDHVRTARYIGNQIGLASTDEQVFDGAKLESISDDELQEVVTRAAIFARVDPVHKIRIVKALQANGEVVAMTGDGVNDAPAIKGADIGVALGSGTDVAKETADMVLLDDAFSTIVAAVEEGRTIYQNIRKVLLYLFSGTFASSIMVTGSLVAGLPLPVLSVQILWMNIVEDAFPVMALAFDRGEKENMDDPPRKKDQSIINREMKVIMIGKSILANVVLFTIFYVIWTKTQDIDLTRTMVFIGLGIDSLFFVFSIRSLRHMVWKMPAFDNKYLILAIIGGWAMLILAVYWAPLQNLLRTVPLEPIHWVIMIGFGLFNLVLTEIIKAVFIIKERRAHNPTHAL